MVQQYPRERDSDPCIVEIMGPFQKILKINCIFPVKNREGHLLKVRQVEMEQRTRDLLQV